MPDIFETILHRRSIRRFEPKQMEEAALQQILRQWNIPTDRYAVMQLLLGYAKEGDKRPTPKPRKEGRVIRMGGAVKWMHKSVWKN